MVDLSRREMMAAAPAGTATPGADASQGASGKSGQGIQWQPGLELYPLGEELEKDFDGTLRKVAEMGYRHVELPTFYNRAAKELKQSLSSAGLSCISAGALPNPFLSPMPSLQTHADQIFDAHNELGVTYVVCLLPPLPARKRAGPFERVFETFTSADWSEAAQFLNEVGRKARNQGLRLAHHNHHFELLPVDGTTGFEIMMKETDPAYVEFEMDCAFVAAMGFDPAEKLRRHKDRIPLLHLKDIEARKVADKALQTVAVGQGIIDWKPVFEEMKKSNVRQYYVELEPPFTKPVLQSLEESYRYVTTALKA